VIRLLLAEDQGMMRSALATLLDIQPGELDDEMRRRMKRMIDKAAKEGR